MFKKVVQFEFVVDGKTGRFSIDDDTPIGLAKEMHFQLGKSLAFVEENIMQAVKAKEEEEKAKKEASKIEEIQASDG